VGLTKLFVRTKKLFVGMKILFVRMKKLFVGTRKLFIRLRKLFVGMIKLFVRSKKLFVGISPMNIFFVPTNVGMNTRDLGLLLFSLESLLLLAFSERRKAKGERRKMFY